MNSILAVVILTGASCISPVEQSDALKVTVVEKVPCAVVIRNPVANPYKVAQEPNGISAAAPVPVVQKVAKKSKSKKKKRRSKR